MPRAQAAHFVVECVREFIKGRFVAGTQPLQEFGHGGVHRTRVQQRGVRMLSNGCSGRWERFGFELHYNASSPREQLWKTWCAFFFASLRMFRRRTGREFWRN